MKTNVRSETAQILWIKGDHRTKPRYSQIFQNVMHRWETIAAELDAAFEEDTMSNAEGPIQLCTEEKYEEAAQQQRDIFDTMAKLNAVEFTDVLAKLELWKAVTCPTSETEEQLSPTEAVMLSAYYDLSRLIARKTGQAQ